MSDGSDSTSKPPPVKVYMSSLSVNLDAKQQQQRILLTLGAKKIAFEKKDVAVDKEAKREFRRLMRGYDPNGGLPQIFNGDYLCGDYESFYWAVEENRLEEYLRLTPPKQKSIPSSQPPSAAAAVDSRESSLPSQPASQEACDSSEKTDVADKIVPTDSDIKPHEPPSAAPIPPPPPPPAPALVPPPPAPALPVALLTSQKITKEKDSTTNVVMKQKTSE